MPFVPLPPLVSTDWLAERLGRPGFVILDTSWYLPTSGRLATQEYLAGHVPGAVFFDLDAASDRASPLPHMLPSAMAFAAYVGGLGVGTDDTVVVFDGSGSNLSAARVWWMFRAFGHPRVALLDGGIAKWRAEGRPMEAGEVVLAPKVFQASDPGGVRDLRAVEGALAREDAQVVDLRPAGRFAGTEPEPRPGIPSGHMPGAISLPYPELVRADGTMLDPDGLRSVLARAGVRLDRPIIATCGSGTSACALLLALHRLGHEANALYDGSWTEWAGGGMPVARGAP
ncbi:MAG TPA: 3-mercaptopyruvate sulfurtransferase [Gemmatimonadales bacterium]|jgi:thiosulfate/3-mercaptopyruvate sulfurtransferase